MHVRDVIDVKRKIDVVPENMPLEKILHLAASSENNYFPVVDEEHRLVGIFSLRDLRAVLTGDRDGRLVLATDIATQPVLTVTPDDDLHTALRRFTRKNIEDIPVVEEAEPRRIIGMLSRRHLISAYHDRVSELQGLTDHAPE
jgi:CIC family chloride channel protein